MVTTPKKITTDLGCYLTMAIGQITIHAYATSITVMCPSYCEEAYHAPAQSVEITTIESIIKLRDFCEQVIQMHEEMNPKPVNP